MDVLSHLLATTEARGVVHVSAELSGRWAFRAVPDAGQAAVLLVTEGTAVVEAAGAVVRLGTGASAVLPLAVPYVVRAVGARTSDAVPVERVLGPCPAERYRRVYVAVAEDGSLSHSRDRTAGNGEDTSDTLLVGAIRIEDAAANPLFQALPAILPLPPDAAPWVGQTLALVAEEAEAARPGAEAVAARLTEVLLVQAIRTYIEGLPERCPDGGDRAEWLYALADPHLGRALLAVHRAPERPWTVEALAAEAFLSRTTFATRFAERVGTPPLRYVARWRVYAAARSLRRGAQVSEAAAGVGYTSESSFSKAFKRATGVTPSAYRAHAAHLGAVHGEAYGASGDGAARLDAPVVA